MMSSILNTPAAGLVTFHQRNPDATVWVGNLDAQATDELVWELMLQVGPVVYLAMPRDKITSNHQGYAFCEFETSDDADYAIRVMNNVKLFGKLLRINKAIKEDKATREKQEWMVNLFIGNLDEEVDEKVLSDIFGAFGALLNINVARDEETGKRRGYAFITFDTFESGDAAIEAMHNQFVYNRQITVAYAIKKDGAKGERHGSEAERLLAAKGKAVANKNIAKPLFSVADLPHVGTNASSSRPAMMMTPPVFSAPTAMMQGYNNSNLPSVSAASGAVPPPFRPMMAGGSGGSVGSMGMGQMGGMMMMGVGGAAAPSNMMMTNMMMGGGASGGYNQYGRLPPLLPSGGGVGGYGGAMMMQPGMMMPPPFMGGRGGGGPAAMMMPMGGGAYPGVGVGGSSSIGTGASAYGSSVAGGVGMMHPSRFAYSGGAGYANAGAVPSAINSSASSFPPQQQPAVTSQPPLSSPSGDGAAAAAAAAAPQDAAATAAPNNAPQPSP